MKRPKPTPQPSVLLSQYAEKISTQSPGQIVDVACGSGRNAFLLNSYSSHVHCIDINATALAEIDVKAADQFPKLLTTQRLDLLNDPWPFAADSLGAIINVHFFNQKLLDYFMKSLKAGGYLFIESIDGHGENYLYLPPKTFVMEKIKDSFDVIYFKEKSVGPVGVDAVTVKLFAKKK